MNSKLQKQKEKEYRSYFLSEKPIARPIREIKHFDNIVDAIKYLTKHWINIEHNECPVFGSGNSVYGYDGNDDYFEIHIKNETALEYVLEQIKTNDFSTYTLVFSLWINRVERNKPFRERQDLIQKFSAMKTEELLKHRRHAGPVGFYLDGWQRQVLKAILDKREHVPNAQDRKNIRKEKAKLQKKLLNEQ